MPLQNEHSKVPVIDPQRNRDTWITKQRIQNNSEDAQENTDNQFNKIRKAIQEKNEKFSKLIENVKKNQNFKTEEYNYCTEKKCSRELQYQTGPRRE